MDKDQKKPLGNLNGKTLLPVIDFDFIANTDLGLIRYIRKNYQDPRAFKLDILNKSDRVILSLLYSRRDINPLSIISTDDNMQDIDGLYNSFMESYKREIINMSTVSKNINDFLNMISASKNNLAISPFISVKDDIEEDEISKKYNGFSIIRRTKKDVASKDPFYIKDYSFFSKMNFTSVKHKKIYMLPLQYSIDYFDKVENNLTTRNAFVLMGNDYRIKDKGETKNDDN